MDIGTKGERGNKFEGNQAFEKKTDYKREESTLENMEVEYFKVCNWRSNYQASFVGTKGTNETTLKQLAK